MTTTITIITITKAIIRELIITSIKKVKKNTKKLLKVLYNYTSEVTNTLMAMRADAIESAIKVPGKPS